MADNVKRRDLLIEIGCEELPPLALPMLSRAFEQSVLKGFESLGFTGLSCRQYATPRRLALLVSDVPEQQAEQVIERRGPALQAAFDAKGNPTKAALGFARSCGVEMSAIARIENDKGGWLYFRTTQPGRATRDCIPAVVEQALSELPIPKRMRWGDGDAEFVRPVHWIVLLFGGEAIQASLLGVSSGNTT
ncbi:MAG TPA: glycine--tRNA ligase subunit beta, partial [Gammaproteobacteria bacterium]